MVDIGKFISARSFGLGLYGSHAEPQGYRGFGENLSLMQLMQIFSFCSDREERDS